MVVRATSRRVAGRGARQGGARHTDLTLDGAAAERAKVAVLVASALVIAVLMLLGRRRLRRGQVRTADREATPPEAAGEASPTPAPQDPDVTLHVDVRRRDLAGHRLDVLAAIAVGGVLGAEARFRLSLALPHAPGGWPTSTLLINTSGCLLIGVLMVVITEVTQPHRLVRPFLGVGVLGGYTTFSAYSTDLLTLLNAGRAGPALAYLVVTPLAALAAVWVGSVSTRVLALILRRRRSEGGRE